ncbi:MAG: MoaD/ThiS family protein [Gammaproteobacteria bacterium]|nr:MoaD/ThiS family protein [Gammaproteobacteria bacterium]
MARVFFPDHLAHLTNGKREFEAPVSSFRELLEWLDECYPGISTQLLGKVAVAIDGDIIHDPFLDAIAPHSEVYFLHRIEGG